MTGVQTCALPILIEVNLSEGMLSEDNDFIDEPPETMAPTDPTTGSNILSPPIGLITGMVWADTDGDTIGDELLPNVEVALLDDQNKTLYVTFTDKDGVYDFAFPIASGKYSIVQSNFDDYVDVSDSEGNPSDSTIRIDFVEGKPSEDNDFVDAPSSIVLHGKGTISGQVLLDTDGNGLGDMPLTGVVVTLQDEDGMNLYDTATDSEGSFVFVGFPVGKYHLIQTNLQGLSDVSDTDGDPLDNMIDVELLDGGFSTGNVFVDKQMQSKSLPLAASPLSNKPTPLAANTPSIVPIASSQGTDGTSGLVSGKVLLDTDGDGIGDTPLKSIGVKLLDQSGDILAMAGTNEEGEFRFDSVPPGVYQITQVRTPDYGDISDSSGNSHDNLILVTLLEGMYSMNNEFVNTPAEGFTPISSPPAILAPSINIAVTDAPTVFTSDFDSDDPLSSAPVFVPRTHDPPSVLAVENSIFIRSKSENNNDSLSGGTIAGVAIASIFLVVVAILFNKWRRDLRIASMGYNSGLGKSSSIFATRGEEFVSIRHEHGVQPTMWTSGLTVQNGEESW